MPMVDSMACSAVPYAALGDPKAVREGAKRNVILPGGRKVQMTSLNGEWVTDTNIPWDNSLAIIGDSFTSNAFGKYTTGEYWMARGYMTHAMMLSGYRFNLVPGGMCADGGSGVTGNINGTAFNTQLTNAIASGARNLTIMGGINDIKADIDPEVVFQAYIALVLRAVRAGMRVFVLTQPSFDVTCSHYTVARQGAMLRLQNMLRLWCRTKAPKSVILIDTARVYTDPASTTSSPKANYVYATDKLHPANLGCYYLGKEIARVWNQLVPEVGDLLSSNADNVAFSSLSTNVQRNGLMIANTGGLATGFTVSKNGSATLGTLSLEARSDGFGNNQVVPVTFANVNEFCRLQGDVYSDIAEGDSFYMDCEVTVASPVNLRGVKGTLALVGSKLSYSAIVNQVDTNYDVAYDSPMTFTIRTPIVKYTADIFGSSPTLTPQIYVTAMGAGSVILKVGRWAVHKIPASVLNAES